MPADWFSPMLILLGTVAWPAAFLTAMWLFRKHIGSFIDDISEVTGFGTIATRSGNRLSKSLRQDARDDLDGVDPEKGENQLDDETDDSYVIKTSQSSPADKSIRPAPQISGNEGATRDQLLRFVGDQIYQKLLNTKRQHSTRSPAVSAELVRTAYSDLRLGVRYLGQHRLGPDAISGGNWPLASADSILKRLGAPQQQIELTKQVRRLEEQVKNGNVRIDGVGARDFIQTAIDVHMAIYSWAGVEVQPTRPRNAR